MTTTTRIEYGAHYPSDASSDPEWVYYGPLKRSEAEGVIRYFNKSLESSGSELRALLVQRTVTTTEWEPANTGVVPPYLTEKTEESE